MLENPTPAAQPLPPPPTTTEPAAAVVKRYAPPNQRNRLHRRKSAEKNQVFASRSVPAADHGDAGGSNLPNENHRHRLRLIALDGCSSSEASQIMNDRWAAAMHSVNDPSIDLSERPVVYSEKTPAWSPQFRLPHQILSPASGVVPQMDFLAELRRAKSSSGVTSDS